MQNIQILLVLFLDCGARSATKTSFVRFHANWLQLYLFYSLYFVSLGLSLYLLCIHLLLLVC